MSIPTGFFTDLTKNYYGIDPSSQVAEEVEVSAMLWKDFWSRVATETDPYFKIISRQDEGTVRQSLITLASEYMSPLSEEALTDIGYLAHDLATQRGAALADLTSKDPAAVKTLLTTLLSSHVDPALDSFILTILPSIADDIAATNGEKQKLYLDYLSGKLETIHTAEATTALSLNEISGRQIVYTLYDLIITLLKLITTNQILESDAATPLVRKKEQYLELMRQMFIYKGKGTLDKGVSNLPFVKTGFSGTEPNFTTTEPKYVGTEEWLLTSVSYNGDPSKYNLGYGDITLQDIFTSLFNSVAYQAESTGSASFSLVSTPIAQEETTTTVAGKTVDSLLYRQTGFDISIKKDSTTGVYTIRTMFATLYRDSDRGSTKWLNPWRRGPSSETRISTQTVDPAVAGTNTDALVMSALASTYYAAYQFAKSKNFVGLDDADYATWASAYMQGKLGTGTDNEWKYKYLAKALEPKIPWPYAYQTDSAEKTTGIGSILVTDTTTTDPTYEQIVQTAFRLRAQKNQMLNTYLDVIRSKMDLVSDSMDRQIQVAETSATAKNNTINILQTIIRQLQNLIASIYR